MLQTSGCQNVAILRLRCLATCCYAMSGADPDDAATSYNGIRAEGAAVLARELRSGPNQTQAATFPVQRVRERQFLTFDFAGNDSGVRYCKNDLY
eukprot:3933641-Rhodomonas_salina.3